MRSYKSNWPATSPSSRGYGTAWVKLRKVILRRDNGLCQCIECQGGKVRILAANEVHHIVSKSKAKALGWADVMTDDPSNLQAINKDCHKRETAAEQGKTLKPKVVIGLDGWPV